MRLVYPRNLTIIPRLSPERPAYNTKVGASELYGERRSSHKPLAKVKGRNRKISPILSRSSNIRSRLHVVRPQTSISLYFEWVLQILTHSGVTTSFSHRVAVVIENDISPGMVSPIYSLRFQRVTRPFRL